MDDRTKAEIRLLIEGVRGNAVAAYKSELLLTIKSNYGCDECLVKGCGGCTIGSVIRLIEEDK